MNDNGSAAGIFLTELFLYSSAFELVACQKVEIFHFLAALLMTKLITTGGGWRLYI
jgi:hypothetical protein